MHHCRRGDGGTLLHTTIRFFFPSNISSLLLHAIFTLLLSALIFTSLASLTFSPTTLLVEGAGRGESSANNNAKDYYDVLGLGEKREDATEREIKSAWRKLSKKHHPDIAGESSRSLYQTVQRAYEVLGDRRKRKIYDILGEEGVQQAEHETSGGGAGNPNNFIFQMFGGGGAAAGGGTTGPNMDLALFVSLEDMYNGEGHTLSFSKTKICRSCRGTGAKSPKDLHTCKVCKGTGHVSQNVQIMPGFYSRVDQPCSQCHGTGKKIAAVCPVCRGRKLLRGLTKISVDVEAGTPESHCITYDLEADQQPGQVPGDVVVSVYSVPHPQFSRHGMDLHLTVRISLAEALLGFEKTIRHLDGHVVELFSTGVTQHLQEERIRGEGMPRLHVPSEKGDLLVRYEVVLPERLTDAQKKAIRSLH